MIRHTLCTIHFCERCVVWVCHIPFVCTYFLHIQTHMRYMHKHTQIHICHFDSINVSIFCTAFVSLDVNCINVIFLPWVSLLLCRLLVPASCCIESITQQHTLFVCMFSLVCINVNMHRKYFPTQCSNVIYKFQRFAQNDLVWLVSFICMVILTQHTHKLRNSVLANIQCSNVI